MLAHKAVRELDSVHADVPRGLLVQVLHSTGLLREYVLDGLADSLGPRRALNGQVAF